MESCSASQPDSHNSLSELTLLYQFSNTMLSTIRLNKLTHLVLTAITAGASSLFERSALFLRNEKSAVLQGMLGVTRLTSDGLQIIGNDDVLGCRWDMSDDAMTLQRSSEFCVRVRSTRTNTDEECPLMHQIIVERRLSHSEDIHCHDCSSCFFVKQLFGRAFAVAPLVARDSTIGLIVVDNPDSGRTISRSNLHFLQLFASQAGMAIENSMLYHRVEETNAELREARERLVHGERLAAIGEMTANLVHELKNPLISIGGFAGRLLKRLPGETQEHCYAATIVKEAGRLEKMLEETLTFSRKPTICYCLCDLAEIVRDSISNCSTTLEDNRIELTATICKEPCIVSGDVHQLKQVFLNLILNACDAMSQGGSLAVSLEVQCREHKTAVVSMQDSGGGVPTEMLHQIFKPFFTTKRHGTGLGLAIANRIALNHSGFIEVENGDKGALFRVVLPLVEQHVQT